MSKMTDEQIIKALECHADENNSCNICTYNSEGCSLKLCRDTLDLINRQQEELEYLRGEREVILEDMQVRNNQVIEQQAEIERLNNNLSAMATTLSNSARQTRADAIKEYKEKLREHAYLDSGITGFQEMVVDLSDIENIADEMVGEQE